MNDHGSENGFVISDNQTLTRDDLANLAVSNPNTNIIAFSDSCFSGKLATANASWNDVLFRSSLKLGHYSTSHDYEVIDRLIPKNLCALSTAQADEYGYNSFDDIPIEDLKRSNNLAQLKSNLVYYSAYSSPLLSSESLILQILSVNCPNEKLDTFAMAAKQNKDSSIFNPSDNTCRQDLTLNNLVKINNVVNVNIVGARDFKNACDAYRNTIQAQKDLSDEVTKYKSFSELKEVVFNEFLQKENKTEYNDWISSYDELKKCETFKLTYSSLSCESKLKNFQKADLKLYTIKTDLKSSPKFRKYFSNIFKKDINEIQRTYWLKTDTIKMAKAMSDENTYNSRLKFESYLNATVNLFKKEYISQYSEAPIIK